MKKWISTFFTYRPAGKHAAPLSRQSGFTIVEFMMSLLLLAIGTALSLPSYREMVEKRQLTHGAEQIMAFVNSAQSEAIKQNRIVTVSYDRTDDDHWCVGAVVGEEACNCYPESSGEPDFCAIDSAPRIISNENVGNTRLVRAIKGAAEEGYCFDPVRGLAYVFDEEAEECKLDEVMSDDLLEIEMRSNDENYRLNLTLSSTGQVILCSNDSGHSVPGYGPCEES